MTQRVPGAVCSMLTSIRTRHTQCLLNEMLSKSYRQKRPRNKTSMAERLAYLRSIRDRGLQMNPQEAPLRQEVIKECAILLKAHPKRRNANTARPRGSNGELEDLDLVSSPP